MSVSAFCIVRLLEVEFELMQPYGSKADRAQSMNHHSFAATFLKETDKILAPFTERER